jgi:hypothetical protein
MLKLHVVYESRPHSVIIALGGRFYRVPKEVPTTVEVPKVVSHTERFFLFMVQSEGEWKVTVTTKISTRGIFSQQYHVEKIVKENKDIFASPIGVPFHC